MFLYKVLSQPHFTYSKQTIDSLFIHIDHIVSLPQQGSLNIVFLDNNSIQKLNKQYRGKDEVTDVLSFHYYEDFSWLDQNEIAGEIILSEEKIAAQWIEYNLGSEKEFYKLVIHSVLHILWYDHEQDQQYKIMQALEDQIWEELFGK